ncbi:DUF1499 domain-containing protein [Myxococcota bacterium]|nr:DUF1499 domain-containing protein [Myxococcota bacterium]
MPTPLPPPSASSSFSAPYDLVHEAARAALARISRVTVIGQDPRTGDVAAVRRGLLPWIVDDLVVRVAARGGRVRVDIHSASRRPGRGEERLRRTSEAVLAALEEEVLHRTRQVARFEG